MAFAEGEHAAVGAGQPVALSVGGRGNADDRGVERRIAERAEERRASESEHAAVGADEPVAGSGRVARDADHARAQREPRLGTEVRRPSDGDDRVGCRVGARERSGADEGCAGEQRDDEGDERDLPPPGPRGARAASLRTVGAGRRPVDCRCDRGRELELRVACELCELAHPGIGRVGRQVVERRNARALTSELVGHRKASSPPSGSSRRCNRVALRAQADAHGEEPLRTVWAGCDATGTRAPAIRRCVTRKN